jgi:NAD(P)-dependent dehydrogenase (short-subunit alcohol dehydrogenase family)
MDGTFATAAGRVRAEIGGGAGTGTRRLAGKTAVITGGTSGIGLATARLFADEGARVIATGTSDDSVAAARAALARCGCDGGAGEVVRSDAADEGEVRALLAQAAARSGAVDVLFLNAGIVRNGALVDLDGRVFDEVMRVNVRGPFLALKHGAPLMRAGGAIVVTTSVANQLGVPGAGAYAASKAAARALVRVAAAELLARRVRVNAISPGPTDTPVYGRQGLPPEMVPAVIEHLTQLVPQRRLAAAREIAGAVLFLASDEASFMTGEELIVDGGLTSL